MTPAPGMTTHVLGELYHPDKTFWPIEGGEFNYRDGSLELRIFLNDPTGEEVISIGGGQAHFALATYEDLAVLCFKFGSTLWGDATYSIWRIPPEERTQPEFLPPGMGAALPIILINARNGKIAAMRMLALSNELSNQLFSVVQLQLATPLSEAEYQRQSSGYLSHYPTSESVLEDAVCHFSTAP